MGEQATVQEHRSNGSVTVVRNDGVAIEVPANAVTAGGWRTLRPGQRVTIHRAPNGAIVKLDRAF